MIGILDTIKKMLGVEADVTVFDVDIITHINSALMVLNQLGVGPEDCFIVTDSLDEWPDFLGDSVTLELVKSYIYLKVKILFDPPTSSTVLDAATRQITEFEWRITAQIEKDIVVEEEEEEDV
jgi:hypothetical protein